MPSCRNRDPSSTSRVGCWAAKRRHAFRDKVEPMMSQMGTRVLQDKFHNAIYGRNLSAMEVCLKKGVNPNVRNADGMAPIHVLAERNDFTLGSRLIETRNVDLEQKTVHGETALHLASTYDSKNFVDLLLTGGHDPDAINRFGKTPLHLAVQQENVEVIQKLLDNFAHVNVLDDFGETPLSIKTVLNCHTVGQIDFVKLLLEKGIDINMTEENSGRNCLHFVALTGYLELAVFLVESGANLEVVDFSKRTPVKVAADHGNDILVDYFRKGYRPPNIITALPILHVWTSKLKAQIMKRKLLEEMDEVEAKDNQKREDRNSKRRNPK